MDSSYQQRESMMVNSSRYYSTYSGHDVHYLQDIYDNLKEAGKTKFVFLAGDSSLDNKYWFTDTRKALNGYEAILSPPVMKADVCYHFNYEMEKRCLASSACLNTAVEASSLNSRSMCQLLDQDIFIRDHIGPDDTLVVSVGGNDIALTPLLFTVLNILPLACCTPLPFLENCACACPPNLHIDPGCLCCGLPGCLSGLAGFPLGMGYFVDLFKNRVQNYVNRLVARTKPKNICICMIYNPDEVAGGSWADTSLSLLCYNFAPARLQCLIRTVFRLATSQIKIEGTNVVPVPLFQVLDGKNTEDYCERVEPSPQGSAKMAAAIMDSIQSAES